MKNIEELDWKRRGNMLDIQPGDPSRGHFYVSLAKSVIRIAAGVALISGSLPLGGGLLIAAEILGVLEEMV